MVFVQIKGIYLLYLCDTPFRMTLISYKKQKLCNFIFHKITIYYHTPVFLTNIHHRENVPLFNIFHGIKLFIVMYALKYVQVQKKHLKMNKEIGMILPKKELIQVE